MVPHTPTRTPASQSCASQHLRVFFALAAGFRVQDVGFKLYGLRFKFRF